MVEAEEKLRIAVVPPLVAVLAVLTFSDSPVWSIGLAFAAALFVQAIARHAEAAQLAAAARRAADLAEVRATLRELSPA